MGAIEAGCRFYFGYPITPQNEIPEYMSAHLPEVGGTFIQAESEIASINMLLGACSTGARAMTSSSSPGISLKQEGLSYMAGSEIPGVVVNMSRSGPGLGGISPSQGDYFQATRGGGHGDYRVLVLAPDSVQECYDLTMLAFDMSDKYTNPVLVLGDAMLGQMKEPLEFKKYQPKKFEKKWALTGAKGRKAQFLKSLYLDDGELTVHNWNLFAKYKRMKEDIRYEALFLDEARLVVVAFGSMARVLKSSVKMAQDEGLKVGLIRPITLFPYPAEFIRETSLQVKNFLAMELNTGQMVEDVRLSVEPGTQVDFFGLPPGSLPAPDVFLKEIKKVYPE
ncbi:MAG: 3-methyl-2-oxobutanoate dehydrogenase subunit VorB [Deltaproteobacteria bacterium]|nr:3-methyl-2-oxobutanoate dehydrogenase subunit VorB [Deltaproteobacteria bacterium]MBW2052332.1 3-methyl-2-oxobutanoate dehydrogenase subunit VorB [Deltaproteobacteria bacterium]MBW2140215.1 3-methyl-2-oxobutanoate dehydrogenase subunit VorB [Deltaproteobacteria bacterium]MBW2323465.1 3-methyl-2-oxobutanoate dehydrogenase subunit VorB [Deltaproteobacteria bacterium]